MFFKKFIEQIARKVFWSEIQFVRFPEKNWHPEIKFMLDSDDAYAPVRAHDIDAGADLRCMEDFTVPAHDSTLINLGVRIQLPPHTKGELKSKSGLNCKECITTRGLIDEGYTGPIWVRVYNHGSYDKYFKAGDKVTQLVVTEVLQPTFARADSLDDSERGDAGLGSTGR